MRTSSRNNCSVAEWFPDKSNVLFSRIIANSLTYIILLYKRRGLPHFVHSSCKIHRFYTSYQFMPTPAQLLRRAFSTPQLFCEYCVYYNQVLNYTASDLGNMERTKLPKLRNRQEDSNVCLFESWCSSLTNPLTPLSITVYYRFGMFQHYVKQT